MFGDLEVSKVWSVSLASKGYRVWISAGSWLLVNFIKHWSCIWMYQSLDWYWNLPNKIKSVVKLIERWIHIRKTLGSIPATNHPDWASRGFPHLHQANTGLVPSTWALVDFFHYLVPYPIPASEPQIPKDHKLFQTKLSINFIVWCILLSLYTQSFEVLHAAFL